MSFFDRMLSNLMGGKFGGHHGRSKHGGHGGYSGYPPDINSGENRSNACAKCGSANAGTARFCQRCGNSISATKCSACGTELAAGARFCGQCGQSQSRPDTSPA